MKLPASDSARPISLENDVRGKLSQSLHRRVRSISDGGITTKHFKNGRSMCFCQSGSPGYSASPEFGIFFWRGNFNFIVPATDEMSSGLIASPQRPARQSSRFACAPLTQVCRFALQCCDTHWDERKEADRN